MDTSWRLTIKERGTLNVAKALGITYQAAHKYVSGDAMPRGKKRKALLEYMRSAMPKKEYDQFKASFNSELLGEGS